MIRQQTERQHDVFTLTLSAKVAAVLRRGGYTSRTIATIVSAMRNKVDLRRLRLALDSDRRAWLQVFGKIRA